MIDNRDGAHQSSSEVQLSSVADHWVSEWYARFCTITGPMGEFVCFNSTNEYVDCAEKSFLISDAYGCALVIRLEGVEHSQRDMAPLLFVFGLMTVASDSILGTK